MTHYYLPVVSCSMPRRQQRKASPAKKTKSSRTSSRVKQPTQRFVERDRSRSPVQRSPPPSPSPVPPPSPSPVDSQAAALQELHLPADWRPQTLDLPTSATMGESGDQVESFSVRPEGGGFRRGEPPYKLYNGLIT